MSTRQDTFYVGSTAPLLLLSVSNVVVVHILSSLEDSSYLFSRSLYIGFNIQIYLYNQMRGTGARKSLFLVFLVITDTCAKIKESMNWHSQINCDQ
jgi:hypothetical protein